MKTLYLLLIISLLGLSAELRAQKGSQILSAEAWTEDLEELYELLKNEHRDLFFKTDASIFEGEFQRIKSMIPQWPDHKIIAEFARLAALANDGHTRLTLPLQEGIGLSQAHTKTPMPSNDQLVFRHLPLEFYWFDDGVYILKAIPSMERHIGKRLLKINDTSIEKALESVKGFCHFDNEYGYKLIAPSRLSILEILMALDIVGEKEEVLLQLESDQGREEISLNALDRFTEMRLSGKAMEENLVLSRQKNDQYYWVEYLEEEKAMYLQINQMNRAESGIGLIRFLGDLHLAIQEHEVDRLILDLRNNFGGSNGYALPIANLLVKNPQLNQFGKFYTLIGRKTFSAAQYLVNDLSKWTNVIFVGEPTGATPSHYGDSKKKQLKHSNLTLRVSSIYWRDWGGDEYREWTAPDIEVKMSGTDYFQGNDPALERALNYTAQEKLLDTYEALYKEGGLETAKRMYIRILSDWTYADEEMAEIEGKLVEWMKGE